MDKDLDLLKGIITDYAINNQLKNLKARDFNADLPILSTLGAANYDKFDDIDTLTIKLEQALKKFVKDWKTLDSNKINYLMEYGIVQEVMKVEERKAVRAEVASRPPPSPKPKKKVQQTPEKSSPPKNLDLFGLPSSEKK